MSEAAKRERLKQVRLRIGQAIISGAEVWMSYDGGTIPKIPRCILPKTWGQGSEKDKISHNMLMELCTTGDHHHRYFRALCLNANIIKTFAVHKVLEVRSSQWELGDPKESDAAYKGAVLLNATQSLAHRNGGGGSEEEYEEGDDADDFLRTDSSESAGGGSLPWREVLAEAKSEFQRFATMHTPKKRSRRPTHSDVEGEALKEGKRALSTWRCYISPASFPKEWVEDASLLIAAHGGELVSTFDTNNSSCITHLLRHSLDRRFEELDVFMTAIRHGVDVIDEEYLQSIVDTFHVISSYCIFDYLWDSAAGLLPESRELARRGSGSQYEAFNSNPPAAQQAVDYNSYYGQGDKYKDYAYAGPGDRQGLTYMTNGNRFWQILLDGSSTKVTYGQIGKKARKPLVKQHASAADAFQFAMKEIRSKASKGYMEEDHAPESAFLVYEMLPPATPEPPPSSRHADAPYTPSNDDDDDDDDDEDTPRSARSTRAARSSRYSNLDLDDPVPTSASAANGTPKGADADAYAGKRELVAFLEHHGLGMYASEFVQHELRTTDLVDIPLEELMNQIDIQKLGHRTRLTRAVQALKDELSKEAARGGDKVYEGEANTPSGDYVMTSAAALAVDGAEQQEEEAMDYDGAELVLEWLKSIRLERYAPCFFQEELDLESLTTIDSVEQLAQLGIDKIGPQNKLLRAIRKLADGEIKTWIAKEKKKTSAAATNQMSSNYAIDRSAPEPAPAAEKEPGAPVNLSMKHIVRDVVVGERVGAGHFGEVYRGEWQDQMSVALKKISKEDSEGMREFEAEATVLMDLRHPNIVTFFGVFVDESAAQKFIVLEWANLGGLDSYLRKNSHRTVGYADLLGFAIDAARGMMYLSERNPPVVHRDLALRNLLLNKTDGVLHVKVGDFGLSRETNFSGEEHEETEQVYMTAHQTAMPIKWIAPETVHTRQFSSRSDIWSFGIVLWEMFTFGGQPYPRMTSREVLAQLRTGYRMAKPTLCSVEVYELMMACWDDDPFLRPTFRNVYNILLKLRKDYQLQLAESASAAAAAAAAAAASGGTQGVATASNTVPSFPSATSDYDEPQAEQAPPAAAAASPTASGWALPGTSAVRPALSSFASSFPASAPKTPTLPSSESSHYDDYDQTTSDGSSSASSLSSSVSSSLSSSVSLSASPFFPVDSPTADDATPPATPADAVPTRGAASSAYQPTASLESSTATSHYDEYDDAHRE